MGHKWLQLRECVVSTAAKLIVIATGMVLSAGPALACKGPNVKFSDDFRQIDDTWGIDPNADTVTVEEGKVKVKADPSGGYTVLYGGTLFDDADFCVTVQVPSQTGNGDQLAAGPVFWAQDYNNYYTFDITPGGSAAIVRRLKGKWVYVLDYRAADGIKTKPGDKNVLRVTTKGNAVTTYINDVKFASVKAQVPDGGGEIGLHAESEKAHRDTWKFIGLKVTDLPE
jgi:hypothetical protein